MINLLSKLAGKGIYSNWGIVLEFIIYYSLFLKINIKNYVEGGWCQQDSGVGSSRPLFP